MISKGLYKKELMGEHYVTQIWTSDHFREIPAGDVIWYKGEPYTLLDPYTPKMINEMECEYEVKYEAKEQSWRKYPMLYIEEGIEESEFTTDSKIDIPLTHVIRSIKESTGDTYTFFYDYDLTDNRAVTFTDDDILSALNRIAEEWNCEWWLEGTEIHLGYCRFGAELELLVGEHIKPPTFTESEEHFSKFRVFGSDRNIEKMGGGANVSVKSRLTLPDDYAGSTIVVDEATNYTKTVVFEDVYPRSFLEVSAVEVTNLYKIKLGDFKLEDEDVIKGETPMIHFNSGNLEGRDFELERTGDWFVVVQEGDDIQFPNEAVKPAVGDSVTIWNIKMPQEYVDEAKKELEERALEYIADRQLDTRQYTARTNPVDYPFADFFDIGQKVLYKKIGLDGVEHETSARLLSIEYDLENEKDGTIVFGNERAKGAIQTLREQIEEIKKQPVAKDGTSIVVKGHLDSTDDLPLDPKKGDSYWINSNLYVWNGFDWVVEDLKGNRGETPYIKDGFWWLGDESTNVKAEGEDGEDGLTPYVGTNGNWWVGDRDLGVSAEGKTGAMSYMAGLYSSSKTYKATASTRPIVFQPDGDDARVGKYYYPIEVGEYTNISPKDNPSIWGVADDFGVVLTDTLVAKFAKVGGAVFVDNWLISQRGYDENAREENDNYELFDGNPVDGRWIPNLTMHMGHGQVWIKDGYFTGEIQATSGTLEDVSFRSNSSGDRVVIDSNDRSISLITNSGVVAGDFRFETTPGGYVTSTLRTNRVSTDILEVGERSNGLYVNKYNAFMMDDEGKGVDVMIGQTDLMVRLFGLPKSQNAAFKRGMYVDSRGYLKLNL